MALLKGTEEMTKLIRGIAGCLFALVLSSHASANVILDFEDPLPIGLVATSYWQGANVPANSIVTDQYLSYGLVVSGAALVAGGVGHSASGANSLAGIDNNGNINYDIPVSFSFFRPNNGGIAGTTNYFAYRPDLGGGSGNVITISVFDLDDSLLGQITYVENTTFTSPLLISGVGQFHKVTVDQTLYNTYSGGIMLDLVEFGNITSESSVPEPTSLALFVLGIVGLGVLRRNRRWLS